MKITVHRLFWGLIATTTLSSFTLPGAVAGDSGEAIRQANMTTLLGVYDVWGKYKDSTPGGSDQKEGLTQLATFLGPDVFFGLAPHGESSAIPFARVFSGHDGAKKFALYHWNSVHADYNVATSGKPLEISFMDDNTIYVKGTAEVTVKNTLCTAHLIIEELWDFDNGHKVSGAVFNYDTTELNDAFRGYCD